MLVDDRLRDRETETRAGDPIRDALSGPVEAGEHLILFRERDPDSAVRDLDENLVGCPPRGHRDRAREVG